jgi:hypothetical protein
MATYAYTFTSGDTVTPTKLNNARTVSEIVNADISATAAIAGTKVAPAFGAQDITVSTANRSITNTGNFALSFGTNNTTRVTIPAAGGISIVTGSPDRIGASFSNNAVSTLDFGSPDSGDGNFQLQYDRAGGHFKFLGGSTGSQTERMRIDVFGNVGIGTSSPIANVHVRSASGTTLRLDQTSGEATIESTNTGVGLRDLVLKGDKLIFNANAAERMRIDASGDIFIGASTATAQGKTQITFDGATKQGVNIVDSSSAASSTAISFIKSSDTRGSITVTASATAYNTSSDYRLKQNVEPLAGGLAKLKSLAPKTFEFKVEPDVKVDGFIAHEVQAVVPQAVTGEKDGEQMQGLDMSKLVPVLVAAVQELTAKVEALEAA